METSLVKFCSALELVLDPQFEYDQVFLDIISLQSCTPDIHTQTLVLGLLWSGKGGGIFQNPFF